jgi:hypothetical protein
MIMATLAENALGKGYYKYFGVYEVKYSRLIHHIQNFLIVWCFVVTRWNSR